MSDPRWMCDPTVTRYGVTLGVYDMTKEQAEQFCMDRTFDTGQLHDWYFAGGRVVVKYLPSETKPEAPEMPSSKCPGPGKCEDQGCPSHYADQINVNVRAKTSRPVSLLRYRIETASMSFIASVFFILSLELGYIAFIEFQEHREASGIFSTGFALMSFVVCALTVLAIRETIKKRKKP